MLNKWIIGNNQKVTQKSVLWNMIASTLNAGLSFLLLLVVTRTLGVIEAGVFSLAYSISQMMLTVGMFDMRTYQATDMEGNSKFNIYLTSRVITLLIMLIASVGYVLFNGYSSYKILIVLLLCVLKAFDAFEDVFHGMLQQLGRLDIAGKLHSIRLMSVIITFFITLFITKNLVMTISLSIIVSIIIVVLTLLPVSSQFTKIELCFDFEQLKKIFIACFPLFLGSYFALYVENSPKYAIDQFLQPEFQTYYNILFMPSYVINLFSGFAFRPMLTPMANSFATGNKKEFMHHILKLMFLIFVFTLAALIGAYLLGIPVLSIVYNIDLSKYKLILLLLILGGGINTVGTAFYYGITIMRHQKSLLMGYTLAAVIALIFTPMMVSNYGLLGGAIAFVSLIAIRGICFLLSFVYFYKKVRSQRWKS